MLVDHKGAVEQRAQSAQRSRRNIDECAEELERTVKPNLMITITLRNRVSLDEGLRRVSGALGELEAELGYPIRAMIAWDRGKADRRLHFHLLVGGVRFLTRHDLWKKWFRRFGRTRIEPYFRDMGGAHYVAKNGFSDEGGFLPWRGDRE